MMDFVRLPVPRSDVTTRVQAKVNGKNSKNEVSGCQNTSARRTLAFVSYFVPASSRALPIEIRGMGLDWKQEQYCFVVFHNCPIYCGLNTGCVHQEIKVWSLEERRNRADLMEVFKSSRDLNGISRIALFNMSPMTHLRGHTLKLKKKKQVVWMCEDTFSQTESNSRWNSLS